MPEVGIKHSDYTAVRKVLSKMFMNQGRIFLAEFKKRINTKPEQTYDNSIAPVLGCYAGRQQTEGKNMKEFGGIPSQASVYTGELVKIVLHEAEFVKKVCRVPGPVREILPRTGQETDYAQK